MITIEEFIERPELWPTNEALIKEWMKELLLYRNGSIDHEAIFEMIATLSDTVYQITRELGLGLQIQTAPDQGDCVLRLRERNLNGSKWGLTFRAPLYKWGDWLYRAYEENNPDRNATDIINTFRNKAQLLTEMASYPQVILVNNEWV